MKTPVTVLELEEYLFSSTVAKFASRSSALDTATHVRETLRLHRFVVMTWLLQNGVGISKELVEDGAHPPVGQQSVDQEVSGPSGPGAGEPGGG